MTGAQTRPRAPTARLGYCVGASFDAQQYMLQLLIWVLRHRTLSLNSTSALAPELKYSVPMSSRRASMTSRACNRAEALILWYVPEAYRCGDLTSSIFWQCIGREKRFAPANDGTNS